MRVLLGMVTMEWELCGRVISMKQSIQTILSGKIWEIKRAWSLDTIIDF